MQTLHGQHVKLKSYAVIVKCLSMNLIPFTDALPVSGYHTGISGIKIPPLFVCHVFPHPPWFQSRPRLLPTLSSVPGSPSRSSTNDYFQLRFSLEILNRQVLRCQGVVGKVQLLKCSLTQEMYCFEGNCMTSSSERSKVINEFMVEYCNNMSRFRLARIATFTLYTRFNIGSTSIQ